MDTKRLYVDFHVLQTVPPSCVNRDDTGSPKTAVYGGAVRARVSSQAWKHAMRVMFTGEMSDAVETGYRTKKGTDLVAKQIKALAPDKDALKLAQKVIEDAGIKRDDKGTGKGIGRAGCRRLQGQKAVQGSPESGSLCGHSAVWPHGGR